MNGEQDIMFEDGQLRRYSRQMILGEVGARGQQKLSESSALVVGAGGLGSPAAIYLAAAGVGTIGLVDKDRVTLENLHRQILHKTADVGRKKTSSAAEHLLNINPDVEIDIYDSFLNQDNARGVIEGYDVVVNGCDNFPTRYLLNDACVLMRKPLVDASVLQFMGQATVFAPGFGCYRCLYPSPPPADSVPSCSGAGVLGTVPGHMGTLQATEALKLLLQIGEPLLNRMLVYDAAGGMYTVFDWERDPDCPVCGDSPTVTELIDYGAFCGTAPPAETDDRQKLPESFIDNRSQWEVSARDIVPSVHDGSCLLVDVRKKVERRIIRIPQSVHVPLSSLQQGKMDRVAGVLEDSSCAVVYCQMGVRSARATYFLRQQGYRRVYSLRRGILGWMNGGGDVQRGWED